MTEKVKPKQTGEPPERFEHPEYIVVFGWMGTPPTEGETPIRWKDCLIGKVTWQEPTDAEDNSDLEVEAELEADE